MKQHILIVEDNQSCRGNIRRAIQEQFDFYEADTRSKALEILKNAPIRFILLDLTLPDTKGLKFLCELVDEYPSIPIIVITENENPDIAASIIKSGGSDYIRKSKFFADNTLLLEKIQTILNTPTSRAITKSGPNQIEGLNQKNFIPNLPEYKKACLQAELAIKGGLSLLIYGETGVGKNMFVRYLHEKLHPKAPLITVDCGAISPTLFESELFGHEKGAFTDAVQQKRGKIELADGGILFLDEISNASLDIQVKLLRVLQEKKVCRVGSNVEIPVDFILVTATNKHLLDLIKDGKFKEDLYFRIKQIDIRLPSLRENKEIILAYAKHYIHFYSQKYAAPIQLDASLEAHFLLNQWLGNIRELELEIQKIIVAICAGQDYREFITTQPSEQAVSKNNWLYGAKQSYEEEEKEKILNALKRNKFKVSPASRDLNIPRTTLQKKITKYQLL